MGHSKKETAAEILKCGVSRVRIFDDKAFGEALTRQDIRNLIRKGLVTKVQKKGTTNANSKKIRSQKKKGRRSGMGNRKARWVTRNPKKQVWIATARPLRRILREFKSSGKIKQADYRPLYLKIRGGAFRNKKHMITFMKERELFVEKTKVEKKSAKKKA